MRKLLIIPAIFLASCFKPVQIGTHSIISNRNVSTKENYSNIKSYVGSTNKELKKNKSKTIDGAITNVLQKVPGAEFLMNCKIYRLKGNYYSVSGDVWGIAESANYNGFKVGDKVKYHGSIGTIKNLTNNVKCTIELDGGKITEANYTELIKIN